MIDEKIKRLAELADGTENIVFFGGAGVSTESGVPDFRSKDGLYNQHDVRFERYSPEYLLSSDCLDRHPDVFFEFFRQKMDTRRFEPNPAHYALAKLEERGKLAALITQNIDGLHQRAGSRNVIELHGSSFRNYCRKCGKKYPADYVFDSREAVPRCSCGGVVRCDVTLYGEELPPDAIRRAVEAISRAELLIVGGTSLAVYPAAGFLRFFRGRHTVVINREHIPYPLDPVDDLEINEPIGRVMSELLE